MRALLLCGWISEGVIYSREPSQDGRFWIHEDWIWGPRGAREMKTGYWIADGWLWGPEGAQDAYTGYFIRGDWIYGPRVLLPFASRDG